MGSPAFSEHQGYSQVTIRPGYGSSPGRLRPDGNHVEYSALLSSYLVPLVGGHVSSRFHWYTCFLPAVLRSLCQSTQGRGRVHLNGTEFGRRHYFSFASLFHSNYPNKHFAKVMCRALICQNHHVIQSYWFFQTRARSLIQRRPKANAGAYKTAFPAPKISCSSRAFSLHFLYQRRGRSSSRFYLFTKPS